MSLALWSGAPRPGALERLSVLASLLQIRTTTSHPAYSQPSSEVVRRFSHFSWLHQKLTEKHKGCIVPALPEKSAVQKFQMSLDFIEQRRRALQVRGEELAGCFAPQISIWTGASPRASNRATDLMTCCMRTSISIILEPAQDGLCAL